MAIQTPAKRFATTFPSRANEFFVPIQREFDRLFDQLGAAWDGATEIDVSTRMDVKETDGGLEITVEMPGVDAKDVKVSVEDNVLTISGEKKSETERKEKDYRVCERAYGSFSRSLTLPSTANADKIGASMDKGVLKLTVPKDGKSKAKTIAITAGN
ncbi:MAG: Hsp20/alpha crystallin family protein [Pseudomonadota bacterium]